MPRTAATRKEAVIPPPMFAINVPWDTMDLLEAQQYYAKLRGEFERAGKILNARVTIANDREWVCFMAGKPGACPAKIVRTELPRSTDFNTTDPKTGLVRAVRLCSERCYLLWQQLLIDERHARECGVSLEEYQRQRTSYGGNSNQRK